MIRGIELGDAERQAREEAALKAAMERGEAAGKADIANRPAASGPAASSGAAAAGKEEEK